MIECKHCGNNDRVIKYGIKAGKQLSQRWYCYNCRSYTPLEESNNYDNNDMKKEKYQKEKTERQLLRLASRSAFAATRSRRSGFTR